MGGGGSSKSHTVQLVDVGFWCVTPICAIDERLIPYIEEILKYDEEAANLYDSSSIILILPHLHYTDSFSYLYNGKCELDRGVCDKAIYRANATELYL